MLYPYAVVLKIRLKMFEIDLRQPSLLPSILLILHFFFLFSTKCRIQNSRYGNRTCKFHLKYCTVGTGYLSGLLKIKYFLASNVQTYLVCNIWLEASVLLSVDSESSYFLVDGIVTIVRSSSDVKIPLLPVLWVVSLQGYLGRIATVSSE